MLDNIRMQYFNNVDNRNNNMNNNTKNDSNQGSDKGSDEGSDDDENKIDNRLGGLRNLKNKKWDSNYNNMIARQKANYQQTLISDNYDDNSNNSLNSSDEVTSDDVDDGDNSSRSQSSDESYFVSDIRNKVSPKLLYEWDDDGDLEQMWGNH